VSHTVLNDDQVRGVILYDTRGVRNTLIISSYSTYAHLAITYYILCVTLEVASLNYNARISVPMPCSHYAMTTRCYAYTHAALLLC